MAKLHGFLVSYRIGVRQYSTEVQSESDSLTPDQARTHVESLHTSTLSSDITDIEVTPLRHAGQSTPGHRQQP